MIRIITDMKPKSHYADGSPIYAFPAGGYPSRGVRALPKTFATAEEAQAHGEAFIKDYEARNWPGGMGCVVGVHQTGDGFRAVVNTYYSFS